MILSELIEELEKRDPNDVAMPGFCDASSYRGYYECLGFIPDEKSLAGDMLQLARSCIGTTFTGYKGGEYTMDANTECFLAKYGESGEPLTKLAIRGMFGDRL